MPSPSPSTTVVAHRHGPTYAELELARRQHSTAEELLALCQMLAMKPSSAWRDETLRSILGRGLAEGHASLVAAVETALDPLVALEERLAYLVTLDPLAALADDSLPLLSSSGKMRLFHLATEHLTEKTAADRAEALALALGDALHWFNAPIAFLEAARLASIYGAHALMNERHLLALAEVQTPSTLARADLLRAISAALLARGAPRAAAPLQAEARELTERAEHDELQRLRGIMATIKPLEPSP